MKVVGLISAYKEGSLVRGAIESLRRVELDELLLFEGPAGEPLGDDVPESEYLAHEVWPSGRWRSDAAKRTAMLKAAQALYPGEPLWGVWLDGDEILGNGEYLRDRLQWIMWEDERTEGDPWARWPLRLIEADGRISTISNRVVRLDLLRSIDVSTMVVTNAHGIRESWGNVPEDSQIWMQHFLGAIDKGMMTAWPPLPCEPYIFHRSHLRHPLRRGLRMHDQEAAELRKL